MIEILMLTAVLLPMLLGAALPLLCLGRRARELTVGGVLLAEGLLCTYLCTLPDESFLLFSMTEQLRISFRLDGVSRLFSLVAAWGWLPVGIYAFVYTRHLPQEDSFYCFYLLSLGAVLGMDYAGNLVTLYLCFELVTLASMPLVLQEHTAESVRAALKYLFYSIGGAFLALCGIFFLYAYCGLEDFVPGGAMDPALTAGREKILRIVVFLAVVGFGAKAGLYPLHGWLPTAHPVAPAPASAVLSAIIAKAGVLAIVRMIFFCVGTDFLAGTWVQQAWLSLSLLTVFMGSMMAYRENVLKKRLAYSTVSQVSYVLTGLFFMSPASLTGALLHVVCHAMIKVCLFLCAGSVIYNTGKTRVDQLTGIGKEMPITLWSFTLASLGLIGIPPFCGFVSKWYLATASLRSGMEIFSWLSPAVLLISAILTAGYLLPITIRGFFPGEGFKGAERSDEGGVKMWLPLTALSAGALLLGIFSNGLADWLSALCTALC